MLAAAAAEAVDDAWRIRQAAPRTTNAEACGCEVVAAMKRAQRTPTAADNGARTLARSHSGRSTVNAAMM